MSLFLKAWPVRWARLWFPMIRDPDHLQARWHHPPVGGEGTLGPHSFPTIHHVSLKMVGSKQTKGPVHSSLGAEGTTPVPSWGTAQTGGCWP